MSIHISKKHKTEHRKGIVNDYSRSDSLEDINEEPENNEHLPDAILTSIDSKLENILITESFVLEETEAIIDELVDRLKNLQEDLPGPKNPNAKYYKKRKEYDFQQTDRTYSQTKNPQRKSKRDRNKRKQKHNMDLIQWLYYNQRKKALRLIANENEGTCNIDLDTLYNKFQERWGKPNNKVINQAPFPDENQREIDGQYSIGVPSEDIEIAIKRASSDSAAGPDYIIPRTLKRYTKDISPILSKILSIMLNWNYVPNHFRDARTILIYKGGDKNEVKNWRPITICSILRRTIEKVIDNQLRSYLIVSDTQTGFTNQPGTILNSSILQAALHSSKANKRSLVVVLLDIKQAFDNLRYAQEKMALQAQPIPSPLRDLAIKLDDGNRTQIQTQKGKTKRIVLKCGLLQGAPTSPQKYNAATKAILDQLNELQIIDEYGFLIHEEAGKITNLAFVDDTAIVANSRASAATLTSLTIEKFAEAGLEINFDKSVAIIIEGGQLKINDLVVDDKISIRALKKDETIRYLGVTFADEIKFDEAKLMQNLNKKLNNIVSTATLRPDQKLSIINTYIFPTLVYPFQTAPLGKLKKTFLDNVDKIIRHAIKEILQIPDDTPNSMLYSGIEVKGLSLIRANWEAYIQNINTCYMLIKANHPTILKARNIDLEIQTCLKNLSLPEDLIVKVQQQSVKPPKPSKIIREELKIREYSKWCELTQKGKGAILYQECPKVNKSIFLKKGLTTSEWISSFKMVGNVASVRALPGRSTETNRCRIISCNEIETLPHVLGACPHGTLLRLERHNKVVRIISQALKRQGWTVFEEFACISEDGSNRRVDILAFDEKRSVGYIIDPTVRFERDAKQPQEVMEEKKRIYVPCIPDIQRKCKIKRLDVIGLLVGARGTIPKLLQDFCKDFHLPFSVIKDITIETIRGSNRIYHHHVYDPKKYV